MSVSNVNREVGMLPQKNYHKIDKILEAIYYDDKGHPIRDTIITEDEILNLKILLNTEYDFNKLLEMI